MIVLFKTADGLQCKQSISDSFKGNNYIQRVIRPKNLDYSKTTATQVIQSRSTRLYRFAGYHQEMHHANWIDIPIYEEIIQS